MKKDNVKNGRLKRSICLALAVVMLCAMAFGFVGCEDADTRAIMKNFDRTDPKDYWGGSIEDLASGGSLPAPASKFMVKITFRKTSTYPELKIEDLKFKNAKDTSYYIYVTPPPDGHYYWDYMKKEDFRQTAMIHLKEEGHDKVIEAIRHLEKLKFIKRAEPNFPNVSIGIPNVPDLAPDTD